jgi:hypothetical protein
MRLKRGVESHDISWQVWYGIGVADAVSRQEGCGEVIVTSLRDGSHLHTSRHYTGEAFDMRTRHMPPEAAKAVYHRLRATLDPQGFDTVLESDHIHCEWDPKLGETLGEEVL